MPVFYGMICITVRSVLSERASPFPTVHHGESSYPTVPQSDDCVVTAPEVALQPVAQGMPPKLAKPTPASLPPLLHPQRKRKPQFTHTPKSSSLPNFAVELCEINLSSKLTVGRGEKLRSAKRCKARSNLLSCSLLHNSPSKFTHT